MEPMDMRGGYAIGGCTLGIGECTLGIGPESRNEDVISDTSGTGRVIITRGKDWDAASLQLQLGLRLQVGSRLQEEVHSYSHISYIYDSSCGSN